MNVPIKYDRCGIDYNKIQLRQINSKPEEKSEEKLCPENESGTRFVALSGEEIKASLDILSDMGRAMVEGGRGKGLNGPDEVESPNSEGNLPLRSEEVSYEEVLAEANNKNKELWSYISTLLEQYGLENLGSYENIVDIHDPDAPCFDVLKKLGEKISRDEWQVLNDMINEFVEHISKAHQLNGYDMEGDENRLKHPVQYGIIANIIDPLRYLYE